MLDFTFDPLIKYASSDFLGLMYFKKITSELCPVKVCNTSFASTSQSLIFFEAVKIWLLSGMAKIDDIFSFPPFHFLKSYINNTLNIHYKVLAVPITLTVFKITDGTVSFTYFSSFRFSKLHTNISWSAPEYTILLSTVDKQFTDWLVSLLIVHSKLALDIEYTNKSPDVDPKAILGHKFEFDPLRFFFLGDAS